MCRFHTLQPQQETADFHSLQDFFFFLFLQELIFRRWDSSDGETVHGWDGEGLALAV